MTHPEHYAGAERLLMLANRHSEGVTYSGSREAVRCVVPECPTLTPLTESDRRMVVILGTGVLVRHCTSPLPGWLVPAT